MLGAAFFTPAVILVARLMRARQLPDIYRAADFWQPLWIMSWESMTLMILPLSISLVVSLMAQMEYYTTTPGNSCMRACNRWRRSSSPN